MAKAIHASRDIILWSEPGRSRNSPYYARRMLLFEPIKTRDRSHKPGVTAMRLVLIQDITGQNTHPQGLRKPYFGDGTVVIILGSNGLARENLRKVFPKSWEVTKVSWFPLTVHCLHWVCEGGDPRGSIDHQSHRHSVAMKGGGEMKNDRRTWMGLFGPGG